MSGLGEHILGFGAQTLILELRCFFITFGLLFEFVVLWVVAPLLFCIHLTCEAALDDVFPVLRSDLLALGAFTSVACAWLRFSAALTHVEVFRGGLAVAIDCGLCKNFSISQSPFWSSYHFSCRGFFLFVLWIFWSGRNWCCTVCLRKLRCDG